MNNVEKFHQAVQSGDLSTVAQMLNDNPMLVNEKDEQWCTPLYWAEVAGNDQMVALLRQHGGVDGRYA